MTEIWFDRKFDFDFPVDRFPLVVERLRGTPARLEELVSSLPPDILSVRVEETWSIKENVGHLVDLEPLWSGRIEDFLAGKSSLRPAELTNRLTHEANHNLSPIQDLLDAFRSARMKMVHRLDRATIQDAAITALHPRLNQPMRLIDSAFFTAEHDDHHLARITELARKLR